MNLRNLIRKVEGDAGISRAQLARDSGLSEAVLLAWVQGERTPRRTSLDRLAAGLEARARALLTLAAELRTAARADEDREGSVRHA